MAFLTKRGAERVERAVRKTTARHRREAEELVRPVLQADERIVAMAGAVTGFAPAPGANPGLLGKPWIVLATDRRVFFLPFKAGGIRSHLTGEVEEEFPREQVRVLEWQVSDPTPSAIGWPGPVSFVLHVGGGYRTYHLWNTMLSDAEELVDVLGTAQPFRDTSTPQAATAHYELRCHDCGFAHSIPTEYHDAVTDYSVDEEEVKIILVYGGQFTVTLKVKDFFTIAKQPAAGAVLGASIRDNMKVLHEHLMSHHDPLFLVIQQSPTQTHHEYKGAPEGDTFVRFSREHGVDIVGTIDLSKAEIPGVTDA